MLRVLLLFLFLASPAAQCDPLWQFSTGGMIAGNPVVHQGVVYVVSRGTHFYAIDAKSGIEKWSWKHATKDVNRMLSLLDRLLSLTLDGETLYDGSANGTLNAILIR